MNNKSFENQKPQIELKKDEIAENKFESPKIESSILAEEKKIEPIINLKNQELKDKNNLVQIREKIADLGNSNKEEFLKKEERAKEKTNEEKEREAEERYEKAKRFVAQEIKRKKKFGTYFKEPDSFMGHKRAERLIENGSYFYAGNEYEQLGRPILAKKYYQKAIENFKNNTEEAIDACVKINDEDKLKKIAEFSASTGRIAEAKKAYEILGNKNGTSEELNKKIRKFELLDILAKKYDGYSERGHDLGNSSYRGAHDWIVNKFSEYNLVLKKNGDIAKAIEKIGGEGAIKELRYAKAKKYFNERFFSGEKLDMDDYLFEDFSEYREAVSRWFKETKQPIKSFAAKYLGMVVSST